MLDVLMIALFQAAAGGPAPAAEPQAVEQQSAEAAEQQNDESADRPRCRMEATIGTRVARRVCTTRRQDREREDESRDAINRAQSLMPLEGR